MSESISNWLNLITLVSFILAIVALLFALVQTYQAIKQTNRLQTHSNTLGLITDSLSTRYIGGFPDYLTEVTKLIESTNSELNIVKGNPIPAYFSDTTLWINYSQALERKIHSGVSVNIISMAEKQRKIRLKQQFPTSKEQWDLWVEDNRTKLVQFLKFGHSDIKPEDLDYAKFLDLLLSFQAKTLNEAFRRKGVDVVEVDQMMPVQVWIADRKYAVFTIQTLPNNAASHGFVTSDARIISALNLMTELFEDQKTKNMNLLSRMDKIVLTKDLDKSIRFYRDIIGLEMNLLSNPVAIFRYDFISIFVYLDAFFEELFKLSAQDIAGNGMLSIEINIKTYFHDLKSKLSSSPDYCTVLSESEDTIIIRDFNNLVTQFWMSKQP